MTGSEGEAGALFGEPVRPPRPGPRGRAETTAFAHSSERLFARLLDFWGIDWEYEPRTFDLAWDDDGQASEQFTPDFYLPAYDLYVELTTMNPKLVSRKNRKIRRLRELYPQVQVKVFYQRDIDYLAAKHGLDMPSEDLTSPRG